MKRFLTLLVVATVSFLCGLAWSKRVGVVEKPQGTATPRVESTRRGPTQPTLHPSQRGIHPITSNAPTGPDNTKVTSEEEGELLEFGRRTALGEYLLPSEIPFMAKRFKESVTNRLNTIVPGIVATRADLLSTLGLSPDRITKLTNHAAKIPEASIKYEAGFIDVQQAKIDYRSNLKSLLSPEQYAEYLNLERQQAVANQTDIKLSDFTPEDARSLVELYESLNLAPSKATVLPFEELSGVILGGPELTNEFRRRIAGLESAREVLNTTASSGKYSQNVVSSLGRFLDLKLEQNKASIHNIVNPRPRPPPIQASFFR